MPYDDGEDTIETTDALWGGADWDAAVCRERWQYYCNGSDQPVGRLKDDHVDGSIDYTETNTYYDSDRLHIKARYRGNSTAKTARAWSKTYTYDAAGRMLRMKLEGYQGTTGAIIATKVYDYTWSGFDAGDADMRAFTPAVIAILFDMIN